MGYSPFQRGAPPERETQMEETILTAQNLKFRYDSDQPVYALDGVSTEVKRGEFVAALGANGCGKSTLAKHFNAILLPESGKVYVEDMDTADDDKLYDIRQTVGMVFQNPDNQIVATSSYKALQAEIETLIKEKNSGYNDYRAKREEYRRLQTVKGNIDQILRRSEPQRRKEQSHER